MTSCLYMKDKIILEKIVKYCDMLDETMAKYGNSREQFENEHIFQNSASMCLLQIGELCKYLTTEFRDSHKEVEWKGWCGLRDVFAHQYAQVDIEENWNTLINDYPVLRDSIKKILEEE